MDSRLIVSSSPQIHSPGSTTAVMAWVLIALVPAGVWSIVLFGLRSVIVILVSSGAAVLTEYLMNRFFKRDSTLRDLSALVTGVLVGFNMPPHVPLFIPIIASMFAIAVVKWSFGGLGANWMNPALAGRIFVFFSWDSSMTQWTLPGRTGGLDALSGATPLGSVKVALNELTTDISGPLDVLKSIGTPITYLDLFLGRIPGSLGEMSALLLILGGTLLIILRIVNWEIPLVYLTTFALLIWMFDGTHYGSGLFTGDALFHLLSGGVMLGAFFMASDLVTSPLIFKGRIIFAAGCGLLTFLIRSYGSLPEGVSLAIIFMNILTPLIDKYVVPNRYGAVS